MNFIAVLANTARSQAYLQTLIKENLKPSKVFILDDNNEKSLGKIADKESIIKDNNKCYSFKFAIMKPKEDLISTLSKTDIPYRIIHSSNINSYDVYEALCKCDEKIVIVSVFAGQILKSEILATNCLTYRKTISRHDVTRLIMTKKYISFPLFEPFIY